MKQKLQYTLLSLAALTTLIMPLAFAPPAAAVTCSVLPSSICSTSDAKDVNSSGIMTLLKWGIKILTGGIGIAAVAAFIYAGILYTSAGDNSTQVSNAKNIMTQTVIGLVVYGLMFFALQWLLPGGIL